MSKDPEDLDPDQLDEVIGGWSGGVYVGVGASAAGNGPSRTLSIGTDGIHVYDTQSIGIGNTANAGGSFGVWGSKGTGADYFTGPGTAFSAGVREGGAVGVEGGANGSGFSVGVNAGVSTPAPGVGWQVSHTEGTEVGGQPPADTSHEPGSFYDQNGYGDGRDHSNDPAPTPTDWSTAFGPHEGGPPVDDHSPGSLSDQAGYNDIGTHDYSAGDHSGDNVDHSPGSLSDQAGYNDIGTHDGGDNVDHSPGSLSDQAGYNDIGTHDDGGGGDYGGGGGDYGGGGDFGGGDFGGGGDF